MGESKPLAIRADTKLYYSCVSWPQGYIQSPTTADQIMYVSCKSIVSTASQCKPRASTCDH